MDADVRGLGVRVTDRGQRTFILIARYRGSKNPARRALGEYPTLTLEKAREKARAWRELIKAGKDPKAEEKEELRRQQRRRENSVATIAERFFERHLKGKRQANCLRGGPAAQCEPETRIQTPEPEIGKA